MPVSALAAGDSALSKIDKNSCPYGAYMLVERDLKEPYNTCRMLDDDKGLEDRK